MTTLHHRIRSAGATTLAIVAANVAVLGGTAPAADGALEPGCTVNELLVNSCRPWFGASSNGYPEVAGDKRTQLEYFEQRVGRQMEMVHLYHGAGNASHVLDSTDLYFVNRPDTMVYLNWPVTNTFSTATGGNATMNGYIDQMARSIKDIAPKKLFLAVHHEPENDLSTVPADCSFAPVGSMGTASDYVAMWHNIRQRFDALEVDNVIWVMNYMNYPKFDCMVDDLWPGNEYVDYISFNGYHSTNRDVSFEKRVGRFYDFLLQNTTPTHDYASKEWGIVEWGIHSATQENTYLYYRQAKAALENDVFPKFRFYMIFDNGDRNRDIWDFMVAYDRYGVYDPVEQVEFNAWANSPALGGDGDEGPPPAPDEAAPSAPGNPAVTLSGGSPRVTWDASVDNVGVVGYDVLRGGTVVGSTTTALAYTDSSAPKGSEHSYTVQARDHAGNISPPSETVSIFVPDVDTVAPTAPPWMTVNRTSGSSATLTWGQATDNVGVTSYLVYRGWTRVATVSGSVTSHVVTGLRSGTRYYFRVRARDAAGNLGPVITRRG